MRKNIFLLISLLITMFVFIPDAFAAPYPPSSVITGISWGNIQPAAAIGSDLWINTWANDGNIYAGWGDGWGFGGETSGLCQGDKPYIGISKITGSGSNWSGSDIFCGGRWAPSNTHPQGKPIGMIAVGNTLYMGVTQQDVWTKYKILKSTDYGKTWYQSNGGLWDDNLWDFNSANGEVMPAFIERGPGYSNGPSDGYIYGVMDSSNDITHDLYLSRVPKSQIMTKSSYRYFAGLDGSGNATWTSDPWQKRSIFYDSSALGWGAMISYVPGLNRYLLTVSHNFAGGTYGRADGSWGLFDAPNPWGPWTTVAYYTTGINTWRDSCFKFNLSFPQKWMSSDGKNLYMTFSGSNECGQTYDALRVIPVTLTTSSTARPIGYNPNAIPACDLLSSSTAVPAGFGASYNVLSTAKELLFKVFCGSTYVDLQIGNGATTQYIYNKGYIWKNNAWQLTTFSCSNLVSSVWCVGNASNTTNFTSTELANTNYAVAYICNWTGSTWKCGCRDSTCAPQPGKTYGYWNLQAFKK